MFLKLLKHTKDSVDKFEKNLEVICNEEIINK